MSKIISNIASNMESSDLRRVRDAIDREIVADIEAGMAGNISHAGKLELMQACSTELFRRNVESAERMAQAHEISHEDGIRYAITIRVF